MRWATERTAIHPFASPWLRLAAACLVTACATSTADGGGADAGSGVQPAVDAGRAGSDAGDATTAARRDATSIFGSGDSGGGPTADGPTMTDAVGAASDGEAIDGAAGHADAARDGAAAGEAGAPVGDGGTRDGGSTDSAGKDSAATDGSAKDGASKDSATSCTAVTVPSGTGGAGACGTPVTGSCGPGKLPTGFAPTATPPTAVQNVCTPAQIQSIYTDCLAGGTCGEADADNPAFPCYGCIFTDATASSWGPIVSAGGLANLNLGGCLQLLEPCNAACATALEEDFKCEQAACATNCPIAGASDVTAYNNCSNTVDNCSGANGCVDYAYGSSCASAVTGAAHPGSVCFANQGNFEQAFLAIVPVFCGH